MIISVSGKIGSGKDTVGKIIQYLIIQQDLYKQGKKLCRFSNFNPNNFRGDNSYEIKKFADKLKDIVCLLIGCTKEQLENQEFKETELGEEWTRYAYADGHNDHYRNGDWTKSMNSVTCSKEKYEEELRVNWQTAYKTVMTPRLLLQLLGTNCGRDIIHPNIWVNSLMNQYKYKIYTKDELIKLSEDCGNRVKDDDWSDISIEEIKRRIPSYIQTDESNWIITDTRFPNELKTVKDKGGISIRINRPKPRCSCVTRDIMQCDIDCDENITKEHESETALDTAQFDYEIHNNGTIEELIDQVKEVLIKEKILC